MIMDTMKSLNVKNMMYVAAFMAATSMAQAGDKAEVSSNAPAAVKEKKSIFERAQGQVSSLAERARNKISGKEKGANEKVTKKEEEAKEKIGMVSAAVDSGIKKLGKAASCVKKQQFKSKIRTANSLIEQAEAVTAFLMERINNLNKEIGEQKDNIRKFKATLETLEKECPSTGAKSSKGEGEDESE